MKKYDIEHNIENDKEYGIEGLRRYSPEESIVAHFCTNQNQCCDEDRCYCVEVVKGAQFSFVGTISQLENII